MSSSMTQLILLVILILLSSFFSASETALTSLSKIRIRNMVEENIKNADKINQLIQNPSRLLSAILIGNNLVNITASAIATSLAMQYAAAAGIAGGAVISFATGIMTLVILIFGEITPKTLASQNSEKIALSVVRVISVLVFVFTPVVFILNIITSFIIRLLGGDPNKKSPLITESELKTLVNVGHEEGVLETDERRMIHNMFEFSDGKAKDIMVPRTDIVALDINATYEEVLEAYRNEHFSRIPIYEENIDDIIGILHFREFIFAEDNYEFDLRKLIREPYFTYEFKSIGELFTAMRAKSLQMAIILDEYGGTAGLVSLEDLVEEIVGEIFDEYDDEEEEIQVVKEDEFIIEGSSKLDDINEMIGTSFESEDFDSIGGYVIGLLGRFPEAGEVVESDGIRFVVEEINKNRIEKLRVYT